MKICVFGASSSTIDKSYVSQVEELGRKIADRGHGLVYGAGAVSYTHLTLPTKA